MRCDMHGGSVAGWIDPLFCRLVVSNCRLSSQVDVQATGGRGRVLDADRLVFACRP